MQLFDIFVKFFSVLGGLFALALIAVFLLLLRASWVVMGQAAEEDKTQ